MRELSSGEAWAIFEQIQPQLKEHSREELERDGKVVLITNNICGISNGELYLLEMQVEGQPWLASVVDVGLAKRFAASFGLEAPDPEPHTLPVWVIGTDPDVFGFGMI